MEPLEIIIALAAAGLVAATVWGFIRRKRSGRSGCGCKGGCSGDCQSCAACRRAAQTKPRSAPAERKKPSA